MKSWIILIVLLTGGIVGAMYLQKPPYQTDIIVLRDVTDNHLSKPSGDDILKLLEVDSIWNGVRFYYSTISDVSLNKQTAIELPAENKWLSNELKRKKDVAKFKADVDDLLNSNMNDTSGREHSSIYIPLTDALNKIAQSKADKKVMVVYSDLMENENDLSFYEGRTLSVIKETPEAIENILMSKSPLPTLQGVEIYFIYQPENSAEDNVYLLVSSFYKHLLESKGATVYIQANL